MTTVARKVVFCNSMVEPVRGARGPSAPCQVTGGTATEYTIITSVNHGINNSLYGKTTGYVTVDMGKSWLVC